MDIRIYVEGHVDDLYALSLLFPEGAYPDLHVVTGIIGHPDGLFDRAKDAIDSKTYVTGAGCLPLLEARGYGAAEWVAREIVAPLNGYAVLADSNFTPVEPVSASFESKGIQGTTSFGSSRSNRPTRLITVRKSEKLAELRNSRVDFMVDNPLAAYAAAVIAGPPSWAEYYRLLEDIAGHRDTTLDKLGEVGLAERKALTGFKNAANNRAFGRHGRSKRRLDVPQDSLMNLLEAREFVRRVVATWLDLECGGTLPRDRVDGGALRFGLDEPRS
jgi:hypothetical protein